MNWDWVGVVLAVFMVLVIIIAVPMSIAYTVELVGNIVHKEPWRPTFTKLGGTLLVIVKFCFILHKIVGVIWHVSPLLGITLYIK
jgi:hypothetical protein